MGIVKIFTVLLLMLMLFIDPVLVLYLFVLCLYETKLKGLNCLYFLVL